MPPPPIPGDIESFAGPPLIGVMLNWFLYGILVTQTYTYYQWFPDDRKSIKYLVYGLVGLDSIQSMLATADAFHWYARGFGNTNILSQPFISAFDVPILDGLSAFIVQSFFCWRIWILRRSFWLPIVIFCVSLTSLAGAIASCVGVGYGFVYGRKIINSSQTFQVANLKLLSALKWQLSLWLGGSALADTLIAIVMTHLLLQSRKKEYEFTDNVIVRVVRLTVETNTMTASVAIVVLVLLLGIPKNPCISIAPAYVLGKLYSNTLLVVFNNRIYMSSHGVYPQHDIPLTGLAIKLRHTMQQQAQAVSNRQVDTEVEPYHLQIQVHQEVNMEISSETELQTSSPTKASQITDEEIMDTKHGV